MKISSLNTRFGGDADVYKIMRYEYKLSLSCVSQTLSNMIFNSLVL